MNTNTNKTYNGAVDELLINAMAKSFYDIVKAQVGQQMAEQVKPLSDGLYNYISSENQRYAKDLIADILNEYQLAYYQAGFRKALDIVLAAYQGGAEHE